MKFQVPALFSRTVYVGKTGSGKTTLARRILQQYQFVVVYDIKGMMKSKDWPGFLIVKTFSELVKKSQKLKGGKLENPKIIYQPSIFEVPDENDFTYADKLFKFIYERSNTVLYIDEVYGCTTARKIPFYFKAILTRGRERGITCMMATQRPTEIPQYILSESDYYFIFMLEMPQDKERVADIKGFPITAIESLRKYEFLIADEEGFSIKKHKLAL